MLNFWANEIVRSRIPAYQTSNKYFSDVVNVKELYFYFSLEEEFKLFSKNIFNHLTTHLVLFFLLNVKFDLNEKKLSIIFLVLLFEI